MNKIFFETFEYLSEDMRNMSLKKMIVRYKELVASATTPEMKKIYQQRLKNAESNLWKAMTGGQKTGVILSKFGPKFVLYTAMIVAARYWYNWATKDHLRVCVGLGKIEKKKCIIQQEIKAIVYVQEQIRKNINQCNNTDDPQKCIQISNNEIKKYQDKIDKLNQQLSAIK